VGKKDLGKGDFMTLFITQLQFQDPMKPMDSNEMASQLAQFSNMEATMKMSDSMEKLLNYQTSQSNMQLLSLLGNEAQVNGNGMAVVEGKASATEFVLDAPAESIEVTIYDESNLPVWRQSVGNQGAGPYQIQWDGKSSSGKAVADGSYHYEVEATSLTGAAMEVAYRSTGKVTGVSFDKGVATITIDNLVQAKASDIIQVK
jgi:flagellar basal-body rod modification protein FlgD